MRFIELFAGIGGFRYGLEAIKQPTISGGYSVRSNRASPNDASARREQQQRKYFNCVWANEIDKYACQIYRKHYKEIHEGDIRTVDALSIPDHDLLCAGFPCQSFSIAGKRGGFEDTRGTLFFEIARILSAKRPKLLLLENVKGLLSHNSGATFGTILTTLSDLGYFLEWQVLNSKDFGVPQNRERVFIVGHLGRPSGRTVFPIGESHESSNKSNEEGEGVHANTLRAGYPGNWNGTYISNKSKRDYKDPKLVKQMIEITKNQSQGYRVYDPEGVSSTLAGEAGGVGAKTGLYAIPVLTPDRAKKRQNGRRMKKDGEPSFTLTGQDIHGVATGSRIRRLTPTECERLQGFPDGWTEGISDTQQYKCLGNAVTTNVIEAIGHCLKELG
jgi:DNA (cytosine-5)-methyltransferase 1